MPPHEEKSKILENIRDQIWKFYHAWEVTQVAKRK
jgi:hypothetical protein